MTEQEEGRGRLIEDPDAGLPPAGDEKIGIREKLEEEKVGWGRGLLIGTILVLVIIGSFWVSFLAGKRVFVPLKKQPSLQVITPEAPAVVPPEVPATVSEPAPASPVAAPETAAPLEGVKLYRVQVGTFPSGESARPVADELLQKGFPNFVRGSGGIFRVQVGAFVDEAHARKLVEDLKTIGYSAIVVNE